jgi:hypothetical protein
MPVWATPKWKTEFWDGDPGLVLDGLEAANEVLTAAGIDLTSQITIEWQQGEAEESSIAEARRALRFAQPPEQIWAYTGFCSIRHEHEGDHSAGEWVGIRANRFGLDVSVKVREDFELAGRLMKAVRSAAERPAQRRPVVKAEIAPGSPIPRVISGDDSELVTGGAGVVGWIESHQGLIAVIGIALTIAATILVALLAT